MPTCAPDLYPKVIAFACPKCGAEEGQKCHLTPYEADRMYDPFHFVHVPRMHAYQDSIGAPRFP